MEDSLVVHSRLKILSTETASDHVLVHPHPSLVVQSELPVGHVSLEEPHPVALDVKIPRGFETEMPCSRVVADLALLFVADGRRRLHETGKLGPRLHPGVERRESLAFRQG